MRVLSIWPDYGADARLAGDYAVSLLFVSSSMARKEPLPQKAQQTLQPLHVPLCQQAQGPKSTALGRFWGMLKGTLSLSCASPATKDDESSSDGELHALRQSCFPARTACAGARLSHQLYHLLLCQMIAV